ncbi:MAG TPA: hypothetical protein VGB34_09900 [Candidatus Limnocylindria bacterium]|jgi:hypothetical protein
MDDPGDQHAPLQLGASGRLQALPLTNAAGDHALLVRQGDSTRALLTGESAGGDRDRVVIVPLDEDVELRMDGDALAIWLARGSVGRATGSVPAWASAIGFVLVVAVIGFAVLGSLTFFAWLAGVLA